MVDRGTLFPDICETSLKKQKAKQTNKQTNKANNQTINTPGTYRILHSHPPLTLSHHGHLSRFREFLQQNDNTSCSFPITL